jgi:hypothetical protein
MFVQHGDVAVDGRGMIYVSADNAFQAYEYPE